MPKTKQQKQQEALERNRKNIPALRDVMLRYQPGGVHYNDHVQRHGVDVAQVAARAKMRWFEKACAEAKVDTHGNPI